MEPALRNRQVAPRVLVVEDDARVGDLISEVVSEAGFIAECVGSDAAAYASLRFGGHAALIVDVNLGRGTTGFDVARFARQIEPAIPVLYVSGQATERSFAAYGVPNSEFVLKPFDIGDFVRRLQRAIRKDG